MSTTVSSVSSVTGSCDGGSCGLSQEREQDFCRHCQAVRTSRREAEATAKRVALWEDAFAKAEATAKAEAKPKRGTRSAKPDTSLELDLDDKPVLKRCAKFKPEA